MSDIKDTVPEDEYEASIVELDGEKFEIIDGMEYENENYVALIPYTEEDDESEEVEFIILRETEDENGEYCLATIDDDSLYEKIGDAFVDQLTEEPDDEEE